MAAWVGIPSCGHTSECGVGKSSASFQTVAFRHSPASVLMMVNLVGLAVLENSILYILILNINGFVGFF